MYTFVFPKNLQFHQAGRNPDIKVNIRCLEVMPHCLKFPYEDTQGKEMIWQVAGKNVSLLENRILDGDIFVFKVGEVEGFDDVVIANVANFAKPTSDSKCEKESIPLAPLPTLPPEWLFCIDTGFSRWWHHRDDLEWVATRELLFNNTSPIEHLWAFRGRHNYVSTPILGISLQQWQNLSPEEKLNYTQLGLIDKSKYDTLEHILENNFAPDSINHICPDTFETKDGIVIPTADYFSPVSLRTPPTAERARAAWEKKKYKNCDRYRVATLTHKLGDISASSEWNIIFNNPKSDGKRSTQQIPNKLPITPKAPPQSMSM